MKKIIFTAVTGTAAAVALLIFIVFLLGSVEKRPRADGPSSVREDFFILSGTDDRESYACGLICDILKKEGYGVGSAAVEGFSLEDFSDGPLIIGVGDEALELLQGFEGEHPFVYCLTVDPGPGHGQEELGEGGIVPRLSSRLFASAALELMPKATHFTLISNAKGACDVQEACDLLDLHGVNYRVETLEERTYGKAVFAAASMGTDAVILPSGDFSCGGLDLSEYGAAVIALGDGEPIKGALGSFCADIELIAADTARLALSVARGEEFCSSSDGYYSLCVSRSVAAELGIDCSGAFEGGSDVIYVPID